MIEAVGRAVSIETVVESQYGFYQGEVHGFTKGN